MLHAVEFSSLKVILHRVHTESFLGKSLLFVVMRHKQIVIVEIIFLYDFKQSPVDILL